MEDMNMHRTSYWNSGIAMSDGYTNRPASSLSRTKEKLAKESGAKTPTT